MLNFVYDNKTTIVFGKGTQHEVGERIKPYGKKVLLHYGGGSVKKSGLYDAVTESLKKAGVEYVELGGVQPNPALSLVYEGIRMCREHGLGIVLAVGGGSVIDSAKAIAMGTPYDGDVWDIYLGKDCGDLEPLPVATILTIPAAGSESSPNTVITNEETHRKLGYGNQKLRPVFSIINPELFFTLPHHQMANGVSDMMSHIFERYFSNTPQTDLSNELCEATLRTIIRNALILNDNLQDYDAWAEIAFCGNIAHNNLLGVGREQDWACHGMEHELSAMHHVAHGAGLAVVTPAWMKHVSPRHEDVFLRFAQNVMETEALLVNPEEDEEEDGIYVLRQDEEGRDVLRPCPKAEVISTAIAALVDFYRTLGLPTTMQELGIPATDFRSMAEKAVQVHGSLGFFEPLSVADVEAIYRLADEIND